MDNQGASVPAPGAGEIWRSVPDYNFYEVSSLGRVRSRYFSPPRMLKPWKDKDGYLLIAFNRQGKRDTFLLHRIVCITFHGPPPFPGAEAAHSDGDRKNPGASNLSWATKAQNMAHRHDHGTIMLGEKHPNAKLNLEQVRAILRARGQKTAKELAAAFGVSAHAVSDIWCGKRWTSALAASECAQPFARPLP